MNPEKQQEIPKDFVQKNIEAVEIINNDIIDIINGQGCLIQKESTTLFGPDNTGNKVKIKTFEEPYGVTSHGYMHCAEVHGEFQNGDRFYIHATSSRDFKKQITSIINELPEKDKKITNLTIRSDFGNYEDRQEDIHENDYRNKINELDSDIDPEVENETLVGFSPPKIVSYKNIDDNYIQK